MTNLTIVTPCRDASFLLADYRSRLDSLAWPSEHLRIVMVEGDSTDDTPDLLATWAKTDPRLSIVTCNTGRPHYGSVVHPERFMILATVFNAGLDAVDLAWSEVVMFLPVDVRYSPALASQLYGYSKPIIAPLVYQSGRFYDIWGFSRFGVTFRDFREEEAVALYGIYPVEMETVGCVIMMSAAVLRAGVRYTPEEVDRGFCRKARSLGFEVYCAPSVSVYHGPTAEST